MMARGSLFQDGRDRGFARDGGGEAEILVNDPDLGKEEEAADAEGRHGFREIHAKIEQVGGDGLAGDIAHLLEVLRRNEFFQAVDIEVVEPAGAPEEGERAGKFVQCEDANPAGVAGVEEAMAPVEFGKADENKKDAGEEHPMVDAGDVLDVGEEKESDEGKNVTPAPHGGKATGAAEGRAVFFRGKRGHC